MGDGAEATIARALISQNDEGCGTAGKALPEVGAMGFLTNGMKLPVFEESVNLPICGSGRDPPFKPRRFTGANPFGMIHVHNTSLSILRVYFPKGYE